MKDKTVIASAIGKIILIGEHSVVYGQPAIALPLYGTRVKSYISKNIGPVRLKCIFYEGLLSKAPKKLLGLKYLIEELVESFNKDLRDFTIVIESSIPAERGMGSSAAVAIAIIRSLYKYFDIELSQEDLLKWANLSEKIIHGNPSGIDAAIISSQRSLYFVRDQDLMPFDLNLDAYLIVADTGTRGETKSAVAYVRELVESSGEFGHELIQKLGNLTRHAKKAIDLNDVRGLGEIMTQGHWILDQLGVSNDLLNSLVHKAIDGGALGAKLTGGGRGGCIIALAKDEDQALKISNKLLSAGVINTWISNIGVDLL